MSDPKTKGICTALHHLKTRKQGVALLLAIAATICISYSLHFAHQPWNGLEEIPSNTFQSLLKNPDCEIEAVEYGSHLRTLIGQPVVLIKLSGFEQQKFSVVSEDIVRQLKQNSQIAAYKTGYRCSQNLQSIEDQYLALVLGLLVFFVISRFNGITTKFAK